MPTPSLPLYCATLVEKVRQTTGYPLAIEVEPDFLEFDSELKLATPGRWEHLLTYRTQYEAYRDHFIVSAATKRCDLR